MYSLLLIEQRRIGTWTFPDLTDIKPSHPITPAIPLEHVHLFLVRSTVSTNGEKRGDNFSGVYSIIFSSNRVPADLNGLTDIGDELQTPCSERSFEVYSCISIAYQNVL